MFPVVRQIDQTLQTLLCGELLRVRKVCVVENDGVKLISLPEASNLARRKRLLPRWPDRRFPPR